MLDVTGFNEYNSKLNNVIGNDTRQTNNRGGGGHKWVFYGCVQRKISPNSRRGFVLGCKLLKI